MAAALFRQGKSIVVELRYCRRTHDREDGEDRKLPPESLHAVAAGVQRRRPPLAHRKSSRRLLRRTSVNVMAGMFLPPLSASTLLTKGKGGGWWLPIVGVALLSSLALLVIERERDPRMEGHLAADPIARLPYLETIVGASEKEDEDPWLLLCFDVGPLNIVTHGLLTLLTPLLCSVRRKSEGKSIVVELRYCRRTHDREDGEDRKLPPESLHAVAAGVQRRRPPLAHRKSSRRLLRRTSVNVMAGMFLPPLSASTLLTKGKGGGWWLPIVGVALLSSLALLVIERERDPRMEGHLAADPIARLPYLETIGCNVVSTPPTLELDGKLYNTLAIGEEDIVVLSDPVLSDHLKNRSCDSFNWNSSTSFTNSPSVSFEVPKSQFLFLFKCNQGSSRHSQQKTDSYFTGYKSYRNCKNFTLYYKEGHHIIPKGKVPKDCSLVQLPFYNSTKSNDLFEKLSPEIVFFWKVSEKCSECHDRGGHCQSDSNNNFKCLVEVVAAVRLGAFRQWGGDELKDALCEHGGDSSA
nr:LEAF RUST 10 DISEASE-RESISTANCE LOCUS RECEPTOR-LIKE PROTEIN KINASE-like 2.4 [Ipomoea trifida]